MSCVAKQKILKREMQIASFFFLVVVIVVTFLAIMKKTNQNIKGLCHPPIKIVMFLNTDGNQRDPGSAERETIICYLS